MYYSNDGARFFSSQKERIKKQKKSQVDWQQVRIQAAIAAMQGLINSCHNDVIRDIQYASDANRSSVISSLSVRIADALVKELKGE